MSKAEKIKVKASAYSLTGNSGKIVFRITGSMSPNNKQELVERLEKIVQCELENHELIKSNS